MNSDILHEHVYIYYPWTISLAPLSGASHADPDYSINMQTRVSGVYVFDVTASVRDNLTVGVRKPECSGAIFVSYICDH